MNKILLSLYILLQGTMLFAQHEVLSPLDFNPTLYNTTRQYQQQVNDHRYLTDRGQYVVTSNILTLPFVDDFSTNRTRSYKWVENHVTDTFYNVIGTCLSVEGITTIRDTLMLTQGYLYSYDTLTHSVDSIIDTSLHTIDLTFFGPVTSNCFAEAPQTITRWPDYMTYNFDSLGRVTDSALASLKRPNIADPINYAPIVYFATGEPGTLWFDNYAYVNNTYPILPPTIGVATLDGLNEFGFPYNNNNTFTYGNADKLTSKQIDLSGFTVDDSLYLSFFFEGKGLGEAPDLNDSLILEFKNINSEWVTMWVKQGYASQAAAPQTFEQVLINVPFTSLQNTFFFDRFQFRFRNKASLYGNLDHWHIDYVKLAASRSAVDTVIQDIAFVYPVNTILKNFTQMPADQFLGTSDLSDSLNLLVRNLDPNANNNPPATDFTQDAEQLYPSSVVLDAPVTQTFNAGPFYNMSFNPASEYTIPAGPADSIIIRSQVSVQPFDVIPTNDTIRHLQRFSNIMAYDDGSAENAYGLTGTQIKKFAYEFNLNAPDTLVGIQIMYTQVESNVSDMIFNINVWDELVLNDFNYEDQPVITLDNRKPYYVDSTNGFTTYILDTPKIFSNKLYAGWVQNQSETRRLQVGYDLNSKLGRPHMFIYTNSAWNASPITLAGSPMIRLIFDSDYKGFSTGIKETATEETLQVYPNPSTGYININGPAYANYTITAVNLLGEQVLQQSNVGNRLNISSLPDGVYVLQILNTASGHTYHHKVIKAGN